MAPIDLVNGLLGLLPWGPRGWVPGAHVLRASVLAGGLSTLAPTAIGQGEPTPASGELRVNHSTAFSQYWVRVARDPVGAPFAFSFNSGQDMFARFYGPTGTAQTGDVPCNTLHTSGVQDEGEIGWSVDGRYLVAWSERSGADGEQMGIFGRIFDAQGSPLAATEFQINAAWQASQWRPLIATHPSGGWIVAWSGDWDGDAFFRHVASDGSFLTGDVPVDTIGNGAQVDTAPAVAPDGTTFVCFVDYSGFGGVGSGTNLWYRMFDSTGLPLMAQEAPLVPALSAADQREPRCAADGLGRFVVVWEDAQADGSGWGIYARRFGPAGMPLGPAFRVNQTTTGDQRAPRVAADASGRFAVTWTDRSGGSADIRARHFDAAGQPLGAEFQVDAGNPGDQELPSLALDQTGDDLLFCYEGPGVQTDAYARFFTAPQPFVSYCTAGTSASGCQALLTASGTPSATLPGGFLLTAATVEGAKDGLFFFGTNGRQASPWGSSTSFQCVAPPVVRGGLLTGSGAPGSCDGQLSQDLNALWCPACPKPAKNPGAGSLVQVQLWYRDPLSTSNQTTSLSDALEFTVAP